MNMNFGENGTSVQRFLNPKTIGKIRRRVQEISKPNRLVSTMDLSHNESTRLAMDALLDEGLTGYQETLNKENEANFLSVEEKTFILNNTVKPNVEFEETDREETLSPPSVTSQTYFPSATESDPPVLDYGWPVADWSYHLQGIPRVEVFFQSVKSACMKDLLRELIRKATKVLAIVMDTFSDVEIFCDLLEATRKRSVYIYLLLDHTNINLFEDMCEHLKINKSHLTNMSIRTVEGPTYCAKSGRKFRGQVKEKFIIVDCTQVLVGSCSFTWLSWQVHRSSAVLFKGSGVKPFDLEFRRLYANSKPVPGLSCQTSSTADPYSLSPMDQTQAPICPTAESFHLHQTLLKPRSPSFPSRPKPPVLVRRTSYPCISPGPQNSLWLQRRNTTHHIIPSQSFLLNEFNIRGQIWRPPQNHISTGAASSHWC